MSHLQLSVHWHVLARHCDDTMISACNKVAVLSDSESDEEGIVHRIRLPDRVVDMVLMHVVDENV